MERDYSNIDVQKSILTKKVYFKDTLLNLSNIFIVVALFSFFTGFFLFDIYRDFKASEHLNYSYFFLKALAVLTFLFIAYRKLTEKKLYQVYMINSPIYNMKIFYYSRRKTQA